ncbi:MAG: hypothetical protein EIB84_02700 [Spiroplasma poulsonii]|uniref:Uncharacterized protein n=2 Tax=Spiroplasma poulsonii TaxID=2138 RepID=A0A2P6FG65_9MOLU|nr:hypothetical protein [Spiroplasma poulsonii]KAF0849947.1 hypothetical protein MSROBK_024050 [Spiroplasma poulsonii]MBW1241779.1 hypothetical protein [Spiroplasma poulsonii]PQM32441.1 hypothetical protein SMSRO_SF023620 [Spiroplasma poulsonii]PWF95107.1 hypothetical protein SMSE_05320 [Spiroplasma poulsonii]PWF97900.1 hypothetical protein SMH99_04500 [Spiroplasma poulsonii]
MTMKDINNMSNIEIKTINKMHLEDKIKKLEKEIIEKNKIIENLYELNKLKIDDIKRLHHLLNNYEDKQLYKEDFDYIVNKMNLITGDKNITIKLKDNSKYEKLNSMDGLR